MCACVNECICVSVYMCACRVKGEDASLSDSVREIVEVEAQQE